MAQIKRKSESDKEEEIIKLRDLAERGELATGSISLYQLDLLQELEDSGDITEKEQAALTLIRADMDEQQQKFESSEEYKTTIKIFDGIKNANESIANMASEMVESVNMVLTMEWNDISNAFKRFDKEHGETLKKYHGFCTIIERELERRKQPSNLWAAAEATEAYVKAYSKEPSLRHSDQISEKDKAEIIRFLDEYLSKTKPQPEKDFLPDLKDFYPMLQAPATNKLTSTSTRRSTPQIDIVTGTATINADSIRIFIEKFNRLQGLRVSTHKVFDAFTMAFTEKNDYRGKAEPNTTISIPLKEYLSRCGIDLTEKETHTPEEAEKERKRIKSLTDWHRAKLKEDLDTLYYTSIEGMGSKGSNKNDFIKMRIFDAVAIKNGIITVNFSKGLAMLLIQSYIMQYPAALLKIDETQGISYYIYKKMAEHYSIDNNRKKRTHNILSVKSLLDGCPDIPTYREVQASDRAYTRRIYEPFDKALEALSGTVKFNYCNKNKEPLTDEQNDNLNYDIFKDCYVYFELLNFPDQTARLEAKAASKQAAKKRPYKKKVKTTEPKSEG